MFVDHECLGGYSCPRTKYNKAMNHHTLCCNKPDIHKVTSQGTSKILIIHYNWPKLIKMIPQYMLLFIINTNSISKQKQRLEITLITFPLPPQYPKDFDTHILGLHFTVYISPCHLLMEVNSDWQVKMSADSSEMNNGFRSFYFESVHCWQDKA